jgi:hypothetical protein
MAFIGSLGTTHSQPGSIVLGQRGPLSYLYANAILHRVGSGSFTADAVIELRRFTADAVLHKNIAASLTADSILKKNTASTFSADAVIHRNVTFHRKLQVVGNSVYFNNNVDGVTAIGTIPTDLAAGDMVFVVSLIRDSGATPGVPNTGGQTWTTGTRTTIAGVGAQNIFYCTYNGSGLSAATFGQSGQTEGSTIAVFYRRNADGLDSTVLQTTGSGSNTFTPNTTTRYDVETLVVFHSGNIGTTPTTSSTGWSRYGIDSFNNSNADITTVAFGTGVDTVAGGPGDLSVTSMPTGNWIRRGFAIRPDTDLIPLAFTADASLKLVIAGSFTADASIAALVTGSFTADAALATTIAGSFTADAVLQVSVAGSLTADAVIKATTTGSVSADAVLFRTQAGAFTADAYLLGSGGDFTADAILRATVAGSLTADAILKASVSGSHTADAITKTNISGAAAANAVLRATLTGSFTANSVLKASVAGSFTADAVLRRAVAGSFTADAITLRAITGSFAADAVISTGGFVITSSFTADALVFFDRVESSFTADAVLWYRVLDETFTGNGYLLGDPFVLVNSTLELEIENDRGVQRINPDQTYSLYNRYPVFTGRGILGFDFKTGSSGVDDRAFIEIDALGAENDDGFYNYPYLYATADDNESGGSQPWYISSDTTYLEVTLDINTWYRVRSYHGLVGEQGYLKIWKVSDPEPAWQASDVVPDAGGPTGYSFEVDSYDTEDFYIDNLWATSPEPGLSQFRGTFTANAVIFATRVFEGVGDTAPTYIGSTSQTYNGFGGQVQVSTFGLAQLNDLVVFIGNFNGQQATGVSGSVNGSLSGSQVFKQGYNFADVGTGGTIYVWSTWVTRDLFGDPTNTWTWSFSNSSGTMRILSAHVFRNARGWVRTQNYTNVLTTDRQTISAGLLNMMGEETLALIAFSGNQTNVISFDPPVGLTELTDRLVGTGTSTHLVQEVSIAGPLSEGPNPTWEANSQTGNSVSEAVVVEVFAIGGIFADAVLRGNNPSFTADAVLYREPSPIFTDYFNDRITTTGWGGVWQAVNATEDALLHADGAVGVAEPQGVGQARLSGYPVLTDGYYTFDVKFSGRDSDGLMLELATSANRYGYILLEPDGTIWANSSSSSYTFALNQWYSVKFTVDYGTSYLKVWPRGTTEPSTHTVQGSNSTIRGYKPSLWMHASTSTTEFDNFEVWSSGVSWRRYYHFTADAVLKKTMVESIHAPNTFTDHLFYFEAEIERGFSANAQIIAARVTGSFSANAVLVTHKTFEAHAVLIANTRHTHERDGEEHTGVDYETVHRLARTIGIYPVGTNLRDVLIAIDQRLSDLEAG